MSITKKNGSTVNMEDNKEETIELLITNNFYKKARIKEDREAHTTQSFSKNYQQKEEKQPTGIFKKLQDECLNCSKNCTIEALQRRIPMINVLRHYKLEYVGNDLMAGFTTAIIQIPQGMSYAILAGLHPIYGIYTSFFPVLIYSFLGTSPHISMGCSSIQTMMLNGIALKHGIDPLITCTVCALWASIYLFLMGLLRLSSAMSLFSSKLVSGFTWGGVVHIVTSQLPMLLGIEMDPVSGIFTVIRKYIALSSQLSEINWAATIVGLLTAVILVINNELIKPWMAKRTPYPLPMELILVISGAAASYALDMEKKYDIPTVGHMPTGLPHPVVPEVELMATLASDALVVTLVGFAITFSLAKLFSSRKGTHLDPQQECYAIALSNLCGSFFSCTPTASAMGRSTIQVNAGARTTVTAFTSCVFLLPVILYFGPFLQTLPKCVLAAIILVSLKSLYLLIFDFFEARKTSRTDALLWLVPCASAIVLHIEYGLYLGLLMAVAVLLYREQNPTTAVLGRVPSTNTYVDMKHYPNAEEIEGVKIFQMYGGLYFSTRDYFHSQIQSIISSSGSHKIAHIVVDLSSLNSVDMDGGNKLVATIEELKKLEIRVYVVTGTGNINSKLERLGIKEKLNEDSLFPSVQDAMAHIQPASVRKPERKFTI